MRGFLLAGLVWMLGCATTNAREETIKEYSNALLQSDAKTMRRYIASGLLIAESAPNSNSALMHVIKVCKGRSSDNNTRYNHLVLFGGGLNEVVNGLEVEVIQEGSLWKITDAHLSVDANGSPVAYLRNCQIDPRFMRV